MADTSKKESKKIDKTAKDDILLSDSDHENLECETCGVAFTDMKSYDSHLKGKKHQKKVSEAKLIAKHSAADSDKEDDSDEDDEDSKDIHCEVCNKDITGYRSYLCHLKGSVHAKNMKKQKLKAQLKDMPEVLEKDDKESGTDDEDCLVKTYARCDTCEKSFTGPESFKSHMKSAAHKKKVKSSQVLQNLKAEMDDESKRNSDGDEFFSKCDVCQKSFSGHIPYKIHMSSAVHKKNVEKKKVAEEMKQLCLNEDTTEGYVCKECKKTFTDPMAFKSHLENNSHEKRKAKEQLNEFLSSHPEIVFVTPLDKEGSDENEDEEYYLICKLCHMSFSGPESAQDHVKSKKHVNTKKAKEMSKQLQVQKHTSATALAVSKQHRPGATKGDKLPQNGNVVNGREKATEKLDNQDDFEMI